MSRRGRFFIDRALLIARAGGGGDGCSSARMTRSNPRGPADGGNGGKGGDVIVRATSRMHSMREVSCSSIASIFLNPLTYLLHVTRSWICFSGENLDEVAFERKSQVYIDESVIEVIHCDMSH